MPVETRFSAPVQTGPGAHPASCTIGTGSFPGVRSGRGVTLTPHPLLVPWSRKGRAIPLPPYELYGLYRASVPVQGCTFPFPYIGLHTKFLLFLSDCDETWIFSIDFLKIVNSTVSSKSVQLSPVIRHLTQWHTNRHVKKHAFSDSRTREVNSSKSNIPSSESFTIVR